MKNYYIKRDKNKKIIALFARPQYEGQEKLKETHKDVVAFQKKNALTFDNENKITQEIRRLAIESLKSKNELPPDFEG